MNLAQVVNSTRAIYGDAGAQTATVVSSLNSAADGVNLKVEADTADLNTNQPLILDDLFYDTKTEEQFPTVNSNGQVAITGALMGWADASQMCLEMSATISITSSSGGTVPEPTSSTPISSVPIGTAGNSYAPRIQTMGNLALNSTQPVFAMLQPLIRLRVFLGENNQVVTRQQMQSLEYLITIAQDTKPTDEEMALITNLGLPKARSVNSAQDTKNAGNGVPYFLNTSATTMDEKIVRAWNNILGNYLEYFDSTQTSTVSNVKFAVPLRYLNSFFRDQKYLPPGLKFRIEADVQTSPTVMAIIPVQSVTGETKPGYNDLNLNVQYDYNWRLVYRSHQLRQPSQLQINQNRAIRPMLYPYTTYEYITWPCVAGQQDYTFNIAISQQRPTSIIIKVQNNTNSVIRRALTTSAAPANALLNATDFPKSDCCAVSFTNVQVLIAGRQNYFLRTINQATKKAFTYVLDGTDNINQAVNQHIDKNLDEHVLNTSYMTTSVESGYLQISLNPGDFQKNGIISSDQGAVVIQVVFTLNSNTLDAGAVNTFGPSYSIIVMKKLQEELTLDAANNITTIQYPAVKTNSSTVIGNTFNMN